MNLLFMDEKGPQNSFKISNPFNKTNKILYANDNMHSYVANVIQIDEFRKTFNWTYFFRCLLRLVIRKVSLLILFFSLQVC